PFLKTLEHATGGEGDHRLSRRTRLHRRDTQVLGSGHAQCAAPLEQRSRGWLGDFAMELDGRPGERAELIQAGTYADDVEADAGAGGRADNQIDAFVREQAGQNEKA